MQPAQRATEVPEGVQRSSLREVGREAGRGAELGSSLAADGGPLLAGARVVARGAAAASQLAHLIGRGGDPAGRRRGAAWHQAAAALGETGARFCKSHGVEVTTVGPLPEGPVVIAPNHLGWIDPLAILSATRAIPVAKSEVEGWPIVGPAIAASGTLFVRRGQAHSGAVVLRRAARALRAGVAVLNFPEGTTSDGSDVLPFKRGVFGLAIRERVPVVPLALRFDPPELAWVGDDAFVPHYLATAARRVSRIELRFGEPLRPGPGESPESLAEATRDAVLDLLRA